MGYASVGGDELESWVGCGSVGGDELESWVGY